MFLSLKDYWLFQNWNLHLFQAEIYILYHIFHISKNINVVSGLLFHDKA